MSSLLGQIFACCLRPRHTITPKPTPPSSPRTSSDAPGAPESTRQKLKERLGNIVRSKEGKMVNVSDYLPFNLQHRSFPAASTSRLRTESPSPHPSAGTGETTTTSRSGSSRRPLVGRVGPPKEPALNVRLVKGRDVGHRGNAGRGRLGRFGEERGVEWISSHAPNETDDSSDAKDISSMHVPDLDAVPPKISALDVADRNHILAISNEIGKQLRDGWIIDDAGPISRSWGD